MSHAEFDWDDDDLIIYLYGESEQAESIRRAAEDDPALRARIDALRGLFDTLHQHQPPAPPDDLTDRLWQRLEPKIASSRDVEPLAFPARRQPRAAFQTIAALAAMLALVVAAFWLGRQTGGPRPDATRATAAAQSEVTSDVTIARERILLTSVGEHLGRMERLFLELDNAGRAGDAGDADTLLIDNRLYRQSADLAGFAQLAEVLDAVERVLTELANAPLEGDPMQLERLRQRLDDQDLLFKVRVLERTLERRIESTPDTESTPENVAESPIASRARA